MQKSRFSHVAAHIESDRSSLILVLTCLFLEVYLNINYHDLCYTSSEYAPSTTRRQSTIAKPPSQLKLGIGGTASSMKNKFNIFQMRYNSVGCKLCSSI